MVTNTEREQQIELLFHSALAHDETERDTFLKTACAGDPSLREEIEARLSVFLKESNFTVLFSTLPLVSNEAMLNAELPAQPLSDTPTVGFSEEENASLITEITVDAYRILRLLGQGGMGSVYLASRDDGQYKKKVAIKVLRSDLDTDFAMKRFRAERQILASLDHPNIARLLDGGTTSDGQPYCVMEYIEGKPITDYCDDNRLSTAERLKLFRKVCAAVHYAHQNLVIHRDIKPSNILVTDNGTPKLLDFGIAKLLNPELADHTLEATATAIPLMTPEYASPEQIQGDTITTATDIYSLGFVLYQLLTGHKPYRFKSRLMSDIAKIICEQEPEKPSAAIDWIETVSTSDGKTVEVTPETISRARDGQIEKLRKRLSGDIDNIVLMAMRKEAGRRYASVDAFSNDIGRHLDGLPVMARQDTVFYRSAKFIRRHKIALLVAFLILATLAGGIVSTTIQRRKAERRFNDVRKLANAFLFEFHDAIADLPGSTPARELIVKRALEYLDSLAREASSDASLQRELATAYQRVGDVQGYPGVGNLSDTDGAMQSFHKALAIREKLIKDNPTAREERRDLATIYSRIAEMLSYTGDLKGALERHRQAIAIEEKLFAEDDSDLQTTRNLWLSYRNSAYAQAQSGDFSGAEQMFRKASEMNERLVAANPNNPNARRDLAINYSALGDVLAESGNLDKGLEMFRKALTMNQELAKADPTNTTYQENIGSSYGNSSEVLERQGNYQAALDDCNKALTTFEDLLKTDPAKASAQHDLGVYQYHKGRILAAMNHPDEALTFYQKAEAGFSKLTNDNTSKAINRPELALCQQEIGLLLARKGDAAGALDKCSKALAIAEEFAQANAANTELRALLASSYTHLGKVHTVFATSQNADVNNQLSEWKQAREWFQKGVEILTALKDKGEWHSPDYGSVEESQRELARCDMAIAKLSKSHQPII